MANCNELWYHGDLSSKRATELCSADGQNGAFLVRKSQSYDNTFVISVLYEGNIYHHRISNSIVNGENEFCIEVTRAAFPSLLELVDYYSTPRIGFVHPLIKPVSSTPGVYLDPQIQSGTASVDVQETKTIRRPVPPSPKYKPRQETRDALEKGSSKKPSSPPPKPPPKPPIKRKPSIKPKPVKSVNDWTSIPLPFEVSEKPDPSSIEERCSDKKRSNESSEISKHLSPFNNIFENRLKLTEKAGGQWDDENYVPLKCKTQFVAVEDNYGQEGALDFKKGDKLVVKGVRNDGWWYCYHQNSPKQHGWVMQDKLKTVSNENWFEAQQLHLETDRDFAAHYSLDMYDDDDYKDDNYCTYMMPNVYETDEENNFCPQ